MVADRSTGRRPDVPPIADLEGGEVGGRGLVQDFADGRGGGSCCRPSKSRLLAALTFCRWWRIHGNSLPSAFEIEVHRLRGNRRHHRSWSGFCLGKKEEAISTSAHVIPLLS